MKYKIIDPIRVGIKTAKMALTSSSSSRHILRASTFPFHNISLVFSFSDLGVKRGQLGELL
jgi:hypothetical protein